MTNDYRERPQCLRTKPFTGEVKSTTCARVAKRGLCTRIARLRGTLLVDRAEIRNLQNTRSANSKSIVAIRVAACEPHLAAPTSRAIECLDGLT